MTLNFFAFANFLILTVSLFASSDFIIKPLGSIINPTKQKTLINSVDFHPSKNLFCVTFTNHNALALYAINTLGQTTLVQLLNSEKTLLDSPQHALFMQNCSKIVVANWNNQTFSIYSQNESGLINEVPCQSIPFGNQLEDYRPHGIALSPCGKFLGVAFGASSLYGRAIALYEIDSITLNLNLKDFLDESRGLNGIPKGITFSPDGTCLLVTFSDLNSIGLFNIEHNQEICNKAFQVIQGEETGIVRPEDIKLTPNGCFCAVSNSECNTVTFYKFDPQSNRITDSTPCYTLKSPQARFKFPHGLAFSPDGRFLIVTSFGAVQITEKGDVFWSKKTQPKDAKIYIYSVQMVK